MKTRHTAIFHLVWEREREEKTKAPKIVSIEFYNVHEPRHGGRGASNPDLAFA